MTTKQRRFVELYDGNGVDACRKAGYQGDENTLGVQANRLLRNAKIVSAIKTREDRKIDPGVKTREERQVFWSDVMVDDEQKMPDRLRASELLGKSEADFIDRQEIEVDGDLGVIRLPDLKPEGSEVSISDKNGLDT